MNEILVLLFVGLLAGTLSGFAGIGGGIVIVPVLVYLLSKDQKLAQGTTLFMFMLPIGIFSVYNYYKAGYVDFRSGIIMASTFLIGGYLGSKLAIGMDTTLLKRIFGFIVLVIAVKTIYDTYK